MSQPEFERFIADLKSNDVLRGEAAELQPDKARGVSLETLVSFAAGKGYSFTAEEVAERVKAEKAKVHKERLSDKELDAVSGGGHDYPTRDLQFDVFHEHKFEFHIDRYNVNWPYW